MSEKQYKPLLEKFMPVLTAFVLPENNAGNSAISGVTPRKDSKFTVITSNGRRIECNEASSGEKVTRECSQAENIRSNQVEWPKIKRVKWTTENDTLIAIEIELTGYNEPEFSSIKVAANYDDATKHVTLLFELSQPFTNHHRKFKYENKFRKDYDKYGKWVETILAEECYEGKKLSICISEDNETYSWVGADWHTMCIEYNGEKRYEELNPFEVIPQKFINCTRARELPIYLKSLLDIELPGIWGKFVKKFFKYTGRDFLSKEITRSRHYEEYYLPESKLPITAKIEWIDKDHKKSVYETFHPKTKKKPNYKLLNQEINAILKSSGLYNIFTCKIVNLEVEGEKIILIIDADNSPYKTYIIIDTSKKQHGQLHITVEYGEPQLGKEHGIWQKHEFNVQQQEGQIALIPIRRTGHNLQSNHKIIEEYYSDGSFHITLITYSKKSNSVLKREIILPASSTEEFKSTPLNQEKLWYCLIQSELDESNIGNCRDFWWKLQAKIPNINFVVRDYRDEKRLDYYSSINEKMHGHFFEGIPNNENTCALISELLKKSGFTNVHKCSIIAAGSGIYKIKITEKSNSNQIYPSNEMSPEICFYENGSDRSHHVAVSYGHGIKYIYDFIIRKDGKNATLSTPTRNIINDENGNIIRQKIELDNVAFTLMQGEYEFMINTLPETKNDEIATDQECYRCDKIKNYLLGYSIPSIDTTGLTQIEWAELVAEDMYDNVMLRLPQKFKQRAVQIIIKYSGATVCNKIFQQTAKKGEKSPIKKRKK